MITTPEQLRKQISRGGNPYSLDFDGVDDYVVFGTDVWSDSDFPNGGSLVCWANLDSISGDQAIVEVEDKLKIKYNSSDSNFQAFMHNPIEGSGSYSCNGTTSPSTGTWYHVVMTWDNSNLKIYVDGSQENSISASECDLDSVSRDCVLGYNVYSDSSYFEGQTDDVRIYDRVLAPTEIDKLYKGVRISRIGLQGHWQMNEGEGTTAHDKSGEGNNGDIIGATWSEDTPL